MVLQMELIMDIPFPFCYAPQIQPSRGCSQLLTFRILSAGSSQFCLEASLTIHSRFLSGTENEI